MYKMPNMLWNICNRNTVKNLSQPPHPSIWKKSHLGLCTEPTIILGGDKVIPEPSPQEQQQTKKRQPKEKRNAEIVQVSWLSKSNQIQILKYVWKRVNNLFFFGKTSSVWTLLFCCYATDKACQRSREVLNKCLFLLKVLSSVGINSLILHIVNLSKTISKVPCAH